MIKLILVSVFVSGCLAGTSTPMSTAMPHHGHGHSHQTHHPHTTHPPKPTGASNIHHGYNFFYDHSMHMMVMRVDHKCYLLPMDAQQQMDVHTSHGLVAIEKTMIDKLDMGAQTTMVSNDDFNAMAMNDKVVKSCHGHVYKFM